MHGHLCLHACDRYKGFTFDSPVLTLLSIENVGATSGAMISIFGAKAFVSAVGGKTQPLVISFYL